MATKYSLDFGKKEKVLNYTCQSYQLSRPNKVGAVMALIRECQPNSYNEWQTWYFDHAYTSCKNANNNTKITKEALTELGIRLYEKITEVVIPEWEQAFQDLTRKDCIDYIYNLTINRTYDGYIREKSVVNDGLAKLFPEFTFEETPAELDHSGDVDYMIRINDYAVGIQIKPITASANFANYSLSERLKKSFQDFEKEFGGKVLIVFSDDGEIANKEVIQQLENEIIRVQNLCKYTSRK